jgi:ADP-dependent NAD(P)H-hydrate dehydratase / NAD(P)H-hydrate epimerase
MKSVILHIMTNFYMKIFSCEQVKEIDDYTIRYEPISSADLMERAAGQLLNWYKSRFERSHRIFIFAGPGNNGGDGLALARMLSVNRYDVEVHYVQFTDKTSSDWDKNRMRLQEETDVRLNYLLSTDRFPVISSGDIIIDAIFGSGLKRSAEGLAAAVIREINRIECIKISIDIPSGLFGEDNRSNQYDNIVRADYTLTFQFPKLAYMFAENYQYTGEWFVLPIGLHNDAIRDIPSQYSLVGKRDVLPMLKKRSKFDHKGNFGHGLLVSGSSGKIGAVILSARAALRSGIGLLTCHVPSCGTSVIHGSVPEAMVKPDSTVEFISEIGDTDLFSAVGVGPGLGTSAETAMALFNLLIGCNKPIIIDADALNILSFNKEWYTLLPAGTILTPHPREFERLAGKSQDGYARLTKQIAFSVEHKCIIILKGAYTSITTSDGRVFFNSTGNPGMATAGSGDVLTGILLSLLAQGLSPENAALLGAFLHGLAGDIAAGESCYESIIASDIINCLGKAFNKIRGNEP